MAAKIEYPVVRLEDDDLPQGPWVFSRSLQRPDQAIPSGALVELRDASDRFVGHGLYNPNSDIAVRLLSRGRRSDLDRPGEFLLRKLREADELRRKTLRLEESTNAYRVVHAEGDDLSGLIVDRLDDVLVCEYHALGFWRLRHEVERALALIYPGFQVLHRAARSALRDEALDPEEAEEAADQRALEKEIVEHGLRFPVEPGAGHKTGWFCDQRDNRRRVASFAAGRDVLDLCTNAGGFALNAARAGARRVQAVDLDEVVLERARRAGELNHLEVQWLHTDAFDHLRGLRTGSQRFGLVISDPHKIVLGKADLETGLRKYNDLNTLALSVVRPGGLLATFSCSGAVSESSFVGMLFQAARRAERGVKLLEQWGAAPDHPQRPDFQRSRYLKGALLAVEG